MIVIVVIKRGAIWEPVEHNSLSLNYTLRYHLPFSGISSFEDTKEDANRNMDNAAVFSACLAEIFV